MLKDACIRGAARIPLGIFRVKSAVLINVLIKLAAAASAFLVQIALVKIVGADGYGRYALFVTYCSLALIFGKYGKDIISLRLVAIYFERRQLDVARAIGNSAFRRVFFVSIVTGIVFGIAAVMRPLYAGGQYINAILIALTVIAMCISALANGLVKGLRLVNLAEGIESLGKPILIAIIAAGLSISVWSSSGVATQVAFLVTNSLISVALFFCFLSKTKAGAVESKESEISVVTKHRDGLVFVAMGLISYGFFQLDTLLLGFFKGEGSVSAYAMACNFVRLVIFMAMILVAQSQATLAVAFNDGDIKKFSELARRTTKHSVVTGAIAALVLVVISDFALAKISPGFVVAVPALLILSLAHIANCALISLSSALNMAGKAGSVFKAQLIGMFLTLPLYIVLIPNYGLIGAAISVLFGIVLSTIIIYRYFNQISKVK